MKILEAIKREERKLEKQMGKLQHQLDGVRAAAKALGRSTSNELTRVKKGVLSAAGRAKISRAAKRRWAKVKRKRREACVSPEATAVGIPKHYSESCRFRLMKWRNTSNTNVTF